jgi:tetratricopeptide (TPR) repeat protein
LSIFKLYILTFTLFIVGCSASKDAGKPNNSSKTQKELKPHNKDLADLPEKERIKFTFLFHNANKERILGNYQLAANLFLQCTQIAPKEASPYYELAHLFESSQEKDLALEYSEKAIKLAPDNYWYRVLYAHSLQRKDKPDEAIKQYEILIDKNGGNIDLYFDLAGMQLYGGKYKESLKTFNLIEKKVGITEEISIQKEKIYIKLGDVEKAAREIENLINAFPDETMYKGLLADLYIANEMPDKAYEIYQEILKSDSSNAYVHLSLYDYYKLKGEDEKALLEVKKAFESADLDIDTKMQILLSYYSVTEKNAQLKKEAFELNKILIKAHPEEAKAYTIYADFLYREKKLEGALKNYLKATEFDNSKFAIWNQILFIESELQDIDKMLIDSKTALELFPNQPLFYFFYGSANLQKKEYKEAAEYLTMGKDFVIDNPPLLAQFYANLGDAHNELKEYEKSDAAYDNALKIEPNNIYVLNNYSYYLSLRSDKLERAEELSGLCNEIEPNQSNYQDTYAWILYKQNKFIQAKEWLEKALTFGGSTNPVILEHLGDVYSKLNNIEKAFDYWTKAKEAGGESEFLDKKIADKVLYE